MRLLLLILLLGCSPRKSTPDPPVRDSKRDAGSEQQSRDAPDKQSRIDHDRLILPDWKPPADVVHFRYSNSDRYIDRTEVTVRAYRECVETGVCTEPGPDAILKAYRDQAKRHPERAIPNEDRCPADQFNWAHPDRADHPVNCVTFWQAWRYCKFRGKRLPIEWEWTAAAGGKYYQERTGAYPWGHAPVTCERAVIAGPKHKNSHACAPGHTMPVGSKPAGATQTGILDMIGNVDEMVLAETEGTESDRRVWAKGGSYADRPDTSQELSIDSDVFAFPSARVGFRCLLWPPSNGRDIANPIPALN